MTIGLTSNTSYVALFLNTIICEGELSSPAVDMAFKTCRSRKLGSEKSIVEARKATDSQNGSHFVDCHVCLAREEKNAMKHGNTILILYTIQ